MKKIFGFVLVLLASILLVGCADPESKVIKINLFHHKMLVLFQHKHLL